MPSILRLMKRDMGIRRDFLPRFRQNAYERIVRRMQNQRWHGNFVDDSRCRRTLIVVLRSCKATVIGGYFVIELAQCPHTLPALDVEVIRKELGLATQPLAKLPQEV